jgi:uncharacterized protein YneR
MVRLHRLPVGLVLCLSLMSCAIGAAGAVAQGGSEITVAPQVLEQYVGVYELTPTFEITITRDGSRLMAQASGQPKLPVYASSETKFFYKVVDAQIEFFKDDKGTVTHLVLYQNKQEMKAPRTSEKVVERQEITVSAAVLAQYVGTYELKPGFDLTITLEGDQLMSQATGQAKVQLFAESETKFFLKVTDAQVEFFKNDKGAVTHLVLHQGPAELKATRK